MIHFPGTEIEKMAREGKGGYIKVANKNNYSRWSSGIYVLKKLSGDVLEAYQRKAFLKFYLRPSRILVFLRNQDKWGLLMFFYQYLKSIFQKKRKNNRKYEIQSNI